VAKINIINQLSPGEKWNVSSLRPVMCGFLPSLYVYKKNDSAAFIFFCIIELTLSGAVRFICIVPHVSGRRFDVNLNGGEQFMMRRRSFHIQHVRF